MIRWLTRLFTKSATNAASLSPETSAPTSRSDTEFSAEIVRITQILPHPNADRLEIARFEMKGLGETTYEVVTRKGETKPGDLRAYFSVDCELPTAHPDFKFLTERLDGAGKTTYRLKAARLRGVFSQGLLVPCPEGFEFGQPVAEHFGVTYYSPPEKGSSGTAPSASAKPKAQPCPVYGVDSIKKMPNLFHDGEAVLVTEKIHGTNFRFGWVPKKFLGIRIGWKFVVGSHRVMKGNNKTGHYYGQDLWQQAADAWELAERTKKHKGLVFYGELYGYTFDGSRIQDLTYGVLPDEGPRLAVFDVRDVVRGFWYGPFERGDVCTDLDLPLVPTLMANYPYSRELPLIWEATASSLDPLTIREGVVIEAMGGPRRKAKWVSQAYLLRDEK
jgi:RNA ligase (TIGR02306 family)